MQSERNAELVRIQRVGAMANKWQGLGLDMSSSDDELARHDGAAVSDGRV